MTIAEHFAAARDAFDRDVQSHQLMCRIADKFAGPESKHHNCLGCNFNDLTNHISRYLAVASQSQTGFDIDQLFSMYAQLLNSCWERMTDIFDIVSVPDGYRARHFSPLIRIRRWANFFKHPKTFGWVVHHPTYVIENSVEHQLWLSASTKVRIVDDEFLKKYYSSDYAKNAGKLRGEFKGFERSTIVVLPDIVKLTSEVCVCLDHFVRIITENPVYVEMLNDTSTIENFYFEEPLTYTIVITNAREGRLDGTHVLSRTDCETYVAGDLTLLRRSAGGWAFRCPQSPEGIAMASSSDPDAVGATATLSDGTIVTVVAMA